MLELLEGAYDLHVHSAPDVVKRRFTDIELAKRYQAAGFRGYAIKSHQQGTAGRAALIREMFPEFNVVGTITLNNAVGGLNPMAVEMAGRMGARICWFPTVDAKNEYEFLQRNIGTPAPYGACADDKTLKRERITILENGKLRPEVFEILEVIKAHDMVLATGHISMEESLKLICAGKEKGLKKMVVTHADYPATFMDVATQKRCIAEGAFIEHNYLQVATGESSFDVAISQIRSVGFENVIISSDGGQITSVPPEEAIEIYCRELLEKGFSEKEVHRIFVENTGYLIQKD